MDCEKCNSSGAAERTYVYRSSFIGETLCLCSKCHATYYVREYAADYCGDTAEAFFPTEHSGGSPEKIKIMQERAMQGLSVFHSLDEAALSHSRELLRKRYRDKLEKREHLAKELGIEPEDVWWENAETPLWALGKSKG